MKNCKTCGKPISDEALFCKHCGAEQESAVQTADDTAAAKAAMDSLGLELRALCDRMTANYVDASARLRRTEEAYAAREKKQQEQIELLKNALEEEKAYSEQLVKKLTTLAGAYRQLKDRLDAAGAVRSEPPTCPRCGKKAEPGAAFCGNCGMRLN